VVRGCSWLSRKGWAREISEYGKNGVGCVCSEFIIGAIMSKSWDGILRVSPMISLLRPEAKPKGHPKLLHNRLHTVPPNEPLTCPRLRLINQIKLKSPDPQIASL
jgi:hypothetical protein